VDEMVRACSTHKEICPKLWFETLKGRDDSKDIGIDGGAKILKLILETYGGGGWTGLMWNMIGICVV
jgi:hypothetical protein